MYHGRMTAELVKLYAEYEEKFGYWVGGIMDLE